MGIFSRSKKVVKVFEEEPNKPDVKFILDRLDKIYKLPVFDKKNKCEVCGEDAMWTLDKMYWIDGYHLMPRQLWTMERRCKACGYGWLEKLK